MSFEHTPLTKGLMVAVGMSSLGVGIFDTKHYLHLQLVPHISRYHQYWRLLAHHAAFTNSSDLFLAQLLFYNYGTVIERRFGSLKFASFIAVSILVVSLLEFVTLLLLHRFGVNVIPAGPIAILFSLLYQHSRVVPSSYEFRIFGVVFTDQSLAYAPAVYMAFSRGRMTLVPAIIGLVAGQMYRSDFADLKGYRLPAVIVGFSEQHLLKLVGSLHPPARTLVAFPDAPLLSSTERDPETAADTHPDENGLSTARPTVIPLDVSANERNPPPSVRQWVNELAGSVRTPDTRLRVPSEAEIRHVATMFPDVERSVIIAALQRSANVEATVETMLRSRA